MIRKLERLLRTILRFMTGKKKTGRGAQILVFPKKTARKQR